MKAIKNTRDLKVEYLRADCLKPHKKNARIHTPEAIDAIKRSIQSAGWTKPIIVDEKLEILAGHGAHQAALQLGMTEVPTIVRKGLTDAVKRAYRLADNKLTELSRWDSTLLTAELGALSKMGFDLALTGFAPTEIEFLLKPTSREPTEPPEHPLGPAISRAGDLWQLGDHRILCADNGKAASWNTLMAGRQAQCVFTDPPYGVSYQAPSGRFEVIAGDKMRRGQLAKMLHDAFGQAVKHCRQDAAWYVWHASATHQDFAEALRDAGIAELEQIIWAKPGIVLGWADYRWAHEPCIYGALQGQKPAFHGDRSSGTVWRIGARRCGSTHAAIGTGITLASKSGGEITIAAGAPKTKKARHVYLELDEPAFLSAGDGSDSVWEVSRDNGHGKDNQLHPNQKPVELARRACNNSALEGEIVVDFFGGSCSTLIAAEQTGRIAYVMELDPQYVDAGIRRWQTLTKKEALHATEGKSFGAIAASRTPKAAKARAGAKPQAAAGKARSR